MECLFILHILYQITNKWCSNHKISLKTNMELSSVTRRSMEALPPSWSDIKVPIEIWTIYGREVSAAWRVSSIPHVQVGFIFRIIRSMLPDYRSTIFESQARAISSQSRQRSFSSFAFTVFLSREPDDYISREANVHSLRKQNHVTLSQTMLCSSLAKLIASFILQKLGILEIHILVIDWKTCWISPMIGPDQVSFENANVYQIKCHSFWRVLTALILV